MNTQAQQRTRQGVIFAIMAYTIWGISPIYFKTLSSIPAIEILIHRIVWSFFLLAGLIHFTQGWHSFREILKNKTKLVYLFISSFLIGLNWLIFIWAVNNNHMLEASLGYYINPIVNIILGMVFLNERLRKIQWVAVILAFLGVAIELVAFGSMPYISFALASSFGIYGLLRKKVNLDAQTGLFIETLFLLPLAIIYWALFTHSETSNMFNNGWHINSLLMLAGVVTTIPLLCFTGAATRIKLSTLGFFQYIGPSLMFILAVTVYGEALSFNKTSTFIFIWIALMVFSFDGIRYSRSRKR
ncbi:chloramphenical resistance permease RarD [Vibrio sp. UCD-FRSSP16_10]|uniref:EamA family transporter RarD n=1 Tax=unclassified Vibrio TaxID=2614977 RepID=UPI0007FB871E|nr:MULTISPECIES: EamA family transporter RarD [unclassified Vibrio]OBT12909.1 chloramphenical resistance permease RarD [Vibrio sp. UCD-FRSSP16_30]OBT18372.1 chloramphenical resistance permease RarD [Vibrio sp. UCD-FRSSP16_10]